MLTTAIACRIGAHLYRHTLSWLSATYIFGTAAATILAVAGALSIIGLKSWDLRVPVLMLIPIAEDMVSFSLGAGALLVALPLSIAVVLRRSVPEFSVLNELGMLTAAAPLLATGFIFQIRSTALTGAALLMVYLATLVLYVNMLKNVQTAAIWLAIGGAVIFGTGILLSIYRDRLLTLPDQVKRREGVFRALNW